MIGRYRNLTLYPAVFHALTGLSIARFDALHAEVAPRLGPRSGAA